jgi:hypothetical protein
MRVASESLVTVPPTAARRQRMVSMGQNIEVAS